MNMNYIDAIRSYTPLCEQEEADKAFFLDFIAGNPDCLCRSNGTAHFTASAWVVNADRSKVVMAYHNIYRSWAWTGGHADGEADLAAVALREVREETGLRSARLLSELPVSLESLTVDGHVKRGKYVHSHLHLNLTYLIQADEAEPLAVKPDENSSVAWLTRQEALERPTERWMVESVYRKLNERV